VSGARSCGPLATPCHAARPPRYADRWRFVTVTLLHMMRRKRYRQKPEVLTGSIAVFRRKRRSLDEHKWLLSIKSAPRTFAHICLESERTASTFKTTTYEIDHRRNINSPPALRSVILATIDNNMCACPLPVGRWAKIRGNNTEGLKGCSNTRRDGQVDRVVG